MKKQLILLSMLMSVFLVACGQKTDSTLEKTQTVTIQITDKDKTVGQEVTFEQGDSVMDVLEEYHHVEEEGGLVVAIDGVSQDPATNTYWLYNVNGEMASKGAEDQLLSDGDVIEFYLETFE